MLAQIEPLFMKIKLREVLSIEEEVSLREKLNEHKYYFNEENLKKAYDISYMSLIDFILLALKIIKPKEKQEIFNDEFRLWISGKHFNNQKRIYADILKNICLKRGRVDYTELSSSINNIRGLGEYIFGVRDLKETIKEINIIFESTMLQDKSFEIM
jgi:hypothetical protein